jgi:hypothetical protein
MKLIRKRKIINFKTVALAIVFMLPFITFGQESNFGNWLIYFGNKQINAKWNWHHEVQYRNYDAIGDLEQLLLRTGLGYNLSENNNNILLGYGYILSENYNNDIDNKIEVNEHRIYQQFITKHKLNHILLQHRFRLEQRFVEEEFKLRVRYFFGLNLPISNKEMIDKTLYLSAYNEIFLNTKNEVFDRNRLYGGIGYKLNDSIRFELGYMNQFFDSNCRDQLNMITFVNF